jgi:PKD repeat protein
VTFIATDTVGAADSEEVQIVVTEFGNHAPVLDSIGPQSVDEGANLTFRIHATDADLDSVILDALNVPSNVTFIDSGNGAGSFSFDPDYTQAGMYNVIFKATDTTGLVDSEVVQITVGDINHAPVLDSIGPKSLAEGETLTFRIHATDVNLDSIILDTLNAPLNVVFIDSGNGAGSFTFTPDFTQASTYYVTFIATDTVGAADSEEVQIVVTEFGNHAPVLDSIGPQSVDEGANLTFRIHATDADLDSIILDTLNVPLNAAFIDSGNGAGSFTFNPDYTQSGIYNVTFIASDGSLADSEMIAITVGDVNYAPVLDSIGPKSLAEGETLTFRIHATDVNLDSIILDTLNAPLNVVFIDSGNGAGSFTFTPDFTQASTYYVTFIATDTVGAADSEEVQIVVTEFGNHAPVLDSIGPQSVDEGANLTFRIHATDADLDSIILDTLNVPLNAAFIDSGNGAGSFTFDPDYTQSGIYNVTFKASDTSGGVDSEVVQITVGDVNNAPVLDSIGPKSLAEGETLTFRIHATDVNLDSIILDTLNAPLNVVFIDSGNGAGSFTFTPDFTQASTYYVTFIATDTVGAADSEEVQIVVTEFGNHAPVLDSIGPQSVDEGSNLTFRIHATDADLDSIILDTLNVPLNAAFIDSGNGAGSFTFNPDYTQSGIYNVTFIASDGSLADSEIIAITVGDVNNAPVLDSIGPKSLAEGETLTFRIHATDVNLDSIVLDTLNAPLNVVFIDSGNGAGSFTFTPDFTQASTYYVTFIATDTVGAADSEEVQIVVTEFGNHAPVLDSIGPQSVDEGSNLTFRIHATDADLDSIILDTLNVPLNAAFIDSGNGAGSFTFNPDYTQSGIYNVTFIASDGSLADSEIIAITVGDVNNAPVLDSIGPKSLAEGETLTFRIHATDVNLDSIVLDTLNAPLNVVFIDSGNGAGSFTFTPDFTQASTYYVTFIATDTVGAADSEEVQIVVTEFGNHAPVLDSIGPQSVDEGANLTFRIHATDADLDSIILDTLNVPLNAAFIDSGNGAGSFTFNPDYTQSGIYNVTFIASDGSLADSEVIAITVGDVNYAPVLDSIGPKSLAEGETLTFRIHATDVNLDSIILDTLNAPLNVVFIDSGNGAGSFTFTPDFTQASTYYVTFIATDTVGAADSEEVQIVVTEFGNHAPVLDSIGPQSVDEGANLTFRIHATDADLDSIILDTLNVPLNAAFIDSGNGAGSFTFNPDYTQSGIYNVTFIASDGSLADSEIIAITVGDVNNAPVLDSIGPKSLAEGETLTFRIHATDVNLDSIILDTLNAPLNATFIDSGNGSGSFIFAPDTTQAGIYYVIFIARDTSLADSEIVTITVTQWHNRPPVLDSIGPKTVLEGDSLKFVVTASDSDGTIPLLSASNLPTNATFRDSGNGHGLFKFKPTFYQAGPCTVTFTATDLSFPPPLSDFEKVIITIVDVNQPPVIDSIGPKNVQAGHTLNIRVVGRDPTDPDGGPLDMSAIGLPENSTFHDSGGGIAGFTFTPDYSQVGVDTVTFFCTDDGAPPMSGFERVVITVTSGANRPPVLDPIGGYKTVREGDTLRFRIHATDPDGNIPFLYTSLPRPQNSVFVDSGNGSGSFVFTPNYVQSGLYEMTFYASDGELYDYEQVLIQVTEAGNQAPILDSIGPKSVTEGETLIFVVHAVDPDTTIPSLSVNPSTLPIGASFMDSANGRGLFEFHPLYFQAGIYHVTFRASDTQFVDSEVVEITVIDGGNQTPVLVLDSTHYQVTEKKWLGFSVRASDADSTVPRLRADSLPAGASFTDNGNGIGNFLYHPDFNAQGVYYTVFKAMDSEDSLLVDAKACTITVIDSNRHPEIRIDPDLNPFVVYEGDSVTFLVIGTDPDSVIPSVHVDSLPTNATFQDSGNGVGAFIFRPDYTQGGFPPKTYRVYAYVVDGSYPADTVRAQHYPLTIQVWNTAVPPVIQPINDTSIVEMQTLRIRVVATHPEGPPTLTAINLPTNSTFKDSGGGIGGFVFTPSYTQAGVYGVTFIATKGALKDSEFVQITVSEAGNQPPVLTPLIDSTIVRVGDTLGLHIRATDPDGPSLTLSTSTLPTNSDFHDSGNGGGAFRFLPDSTQMDSVYHVTFIASDGFLADSETVAMLVGTYIPGDANGDGVVDAGDIVYLLNYLFVGGPAPTPPAAGDANHDGVVDAADVVYLLNYLYAGGPPPLKNG